MTTVYGLMRRALDVLESIGAVGASIDTRHNDDQLYVSYPTTGLGKPQTAFETGRAAFDAAGLRTTWHSVDRNQILLTLKDAGGVA